MISVSRSNRRLKRAEILSRGAPSAVRSVPHDAFLRDRPSGERARARVQIEALDSRAGEGPRALLANVVGVDAPADFEPHPRNMRHAIVDAAEEVIEEARLSRLRLVAEIDLPLSPSVGPEPLVLRGDPFESAERSSGVQPLVGPACTHQGRDVDRLELGAFVRPVGVVERVLLHALEKVLRHAVRAVVVGLETAARQLRRQADFRDPAVKRQLAVGVGEPLPGIDCAKVRRTKARAHPLRPGEVRDAREPDRAGTPRLGRCPFHEIRRNRVRSAWRRPARLLPTSTSRARRHERRHSPWGPKTPGPALRRLHSRSSRSARRRSRTCGRGRRAPAARPSRTVSSPRGPDISCRRSADRRSLTATLRRVGAR